MKFWTPTPARVTWGEFSLGFNPWILNPMCDILFDEKIAGSLHFTPGQAYEECDNGNRSAVHWDMVLIQRPEWGGGEVWFDGELIRKNGLFVPKDLKPLNPAKIEITRLDVLLWRHQSRRMKIFMRLVYCIITGVFLSRKFLRRNRC